MRLDGASCTRQCALSGTPPERGIFCRWNIVMNATVGTSASVRELEASCLRF
jgi:hypothetical protein